MAIQALGRRAGVPHRHGGFDHNGRLWRILHRQADHRLHAGRIKVIFLRVIVRRGGHNDKVCPAVSSLCVQRRRQIHLVVGQILLDLRVRNGALAAVDHLHLFGQNVHRPHLMILGQKDAVGHAHISCARYGNFHAQVPRFLHAFMISRRGKKVKAAGHFCRFLPGRPGCDLYRNLLQCNLVG